MSDASKPFSWATPASASLRRAYRVQLPSGHIKKMSLDELDVAYRGSLIDEGSFVLTEGSTQWTTLGELLEAADAAPPSPPVTSLAPPPVVTDLDVDIPVDVALEEGDVDLAIPPPPPRRRVGRALAALALFTLAAGGAFAAVKGKALWPHAESATREGTRGGTTLAVAAPARPPEPPSPSPAPPPPPEPTPIVVVPADDAEVAAKEPSRPSKIKKSTKGGGRKRGTTKRAHPSPKKKAKKARAESSPFTGM